MQNTWDQRLSPFPDSSDSSNLGLGSKTDSRTNNVRSSDWDKQRFLIGSINERSISAPPSNDATTSIGNAVRDNNLGNNLLFGIGESGISSKEQDRHLLMEKYKTKSARELLPPSHFSTDPLSRSLSSRPSSTPSEDINSNLLSRSLRGGVSSAYKDMNDHYGVSTKTQSTLPGNTTLGQLPTKLKGTGNHVGFKLESSHVDGFDSFSSLERPKSAAPKISLAPPPGLENPNSSPSFDGYRVDRLTSIESALKRPASTGVIGDSNHSFYTSTSVLGNMGIHHSESSASADSSNERSSSIDNAEGAGGRQAQKTLMELIQEDFPKSPSPAYYTNSQSQQNRPRSVSPPSTKFFYSPRRLTSSSSSSNLNHDSYDDERVVQQVNHEPKQEHADHKSIRHTNVVSISKDAEPDGTKLPSNYVSNQAPQYVTIPVSQLQRATTSTTSTQHAQHPTYTNTDSHHQHLQPQTQVHHQAHHYEVPIYYSTQPQAHHQDVHSGSTNEQVIHHQSAPMYVNTNAPYYTVQYAAPPTRIHHPHYPIQTTAPVHSHNHPHHVPHQPEYISIVPIHHPPVATVSPNGSYTYWHPGQPHPPPSDPHQPATVAVLHHTINPQPVHGATVNTNSGSSPSSNTRQQQRQKSGSRNSADKSKGKRSGKRGSGSALGNDSSSSSKHGAGESTVLTEFRNSKNRSWTVHDIAGHVVEFCQDQNGSRFIQQRLEVADVQEKLAVMREVLQSIRLLRNDVFGNYVVQKLLEHGTDFMKEELRDSLISEMLPLSLQMYGCRVIQKALESLLDDDVITLLSEFHGNVITCIHDQNGNHVMQKCIEVMSTKAKKDPTHEPPHCNRILFIIEDVLSNVSSLSCHPYGCRVMQRILEHCVDEQRIRALDQISTCHRTLLDDQYGNYVIQHVLQFGRHSDRDSILEIVAESGLLTLSRQKFASNVVEKLLKFGSAGQRNAIVREMLKTPADSDPGTGREGSSVVLLMVRDAYANYVVQTTLDVVSEGEERRALLQELNSHSEQLRNYTFAKHIVSKLSS